MFKSLRLVEIMHSHERLLVIPIYFSVTWSVVCHIRLPCLNGSTDLDAILAGTLAGSSDHDPLRERWDLLFKPPTLASNYLLLFDLMTKGRSH